MIITSHKTLKQSAKSKLWAICLTALTSFAMLSWHTADAATYQVVYHVVESGETLSGLSKKFDISIDDLTKVNGIGYGPIKKGQRLLIPINKVVTEKTNATNQSNKISATQARSDKTKVKLGKDSKYRVQSGDTLSGISAKYNVTMNALMNANNIGEDYMLRPGDLLIVPSDLVVKKSQNTTKKNKVTAKITKTVKATQHIVTSGENLSHIAKKYNVSIDSLISVNELDNNDYINIGQTLRLPKGARRPVNSEEKNRRIATNSDTY